jgi:peptidoglycan/xylan/chitin deacetylase (PgdA/CDA1 family)
VARSPVEWAARRAGSRRLAVLAYHAVGDERRFDAQLAFLQDRCTVVSLEQVVEAQRGGSPLPAGAVLITFDDGDRSVLEVGVPLLVQRGLPAVAFVVSSLIGTQQPPWWTEVEELTTRIGRVPAAEVRVLKQVPDAERRARIDALREAAGPASPHPNLAPADLVAMEAAGIAIGNHSLSHPCLDRCGDREIRDEIEQAHEALSSWLGHPPSALAYPNGGEDPRVVAATRAAGYELAFLLDHRLAVIPGPDPLRTSRIRVDAAHTLDHFRLALSGLHPLVHRLRGGT